VHSRRSLACSPAAVDWQNNCGHDSESLVRLFYGKKSHR
jgi:hypothetical protein